MPENEITKEYFLTEYHKFREIMCSMTSVDDKLNAFKGLLYVYMNLDPKLSVDDKELCDMSMQSLSLELSMRIGYQAQIEIEKLGLNLDM